MKYSKNFDRDYNWYLNNLDNFNFCGTLNPKYKAIEDSTGISAKECLYYIESQGKNMPCYESNLLNKLLLTKASINFMIKLWVEGIVEGTLPLVELSKDLVYDKYPKLYPNRNELEDLKVLEWENKEPVYYRDIKEQYNLLDWMIKAILNQANR